jgi:hypothetical protein
MKVHLMHPDRDFALRSELSDHEQALVQDLELVTLWNAMAAGDSFVFEVSKAGLLDSLQQPDAIVYRQQALDDCIRQPEVIRELYALAVEAIQAQRQIWRALGRDHPDGVVRTSVQKLEVLVEYLKRLQHAADEHAAKFSSPAFRELFAMLARELDDEYLERLERHLAELKFPKGTLISARLGKRNKGTAYRLHVPRAHGLLERLGLGGGSAHSFSIPERDQAGWRALELLHNKGLASIAGQLEVATEHVVGFFSMLCTELAFYVGCLNLHDRLQELGEPTCLPAPMPSGERALTATGLRDPCLALQLGHGVVGNELAADGKAFVIITGANQGGKSTFLRSAGLAQLMMQAGMFAGAESLSASVAAGVFTHYKREEDETMTSGKLDEELARMSQIADTIKPGAVLLCNESFASTNEREGSQIARQVTQAMLDSNVRVLYVTHLYDLAHGFYDERRTDALFLRAERRDDGTRSFRLAEAEPLPTSYGVDSYRKIFGGDRRPAPALADAKS